MTPQADGTFKTLQASRESNMAARIPRSILAALLLLPLLPLSPAEASHGEESVTVMNGKFPAPVQQVSAVWDGNRYAYIFGGTIAAGSVATPSAAIYRYDVTSDTILTMPAVLPTARMGTSAVWDPRDRPLQGCPDGCAYVFGGANGPLYDDIVRYNPTLQTVTILEAKLPTARMGTTAVWTGSAALILGGGDDLVGVLDEILVFDPLTETVSTAAARLPLHIIWGAATWDPTARLACPQGCAYLFGGAQGTDERDQIIRLQAAGDEAITLSAKLPSPRLWLAATRGDRFIHIFGGDGPPGHYGGLLNEVLSFDPATGHLVVMNGALTKHTSAAAAVWANGAAYIFGGNKMRSETEGGMSAEIERYHPPATLPPVASFNVSTAPLRVDVDASASYDVDGMIQSYEWEWGDGSARSSGATAMHTYPREGTYAVNLTVTDNQGGVRVVRQNVVVPPPPNQPPLVSFTLSTADLRVTADASASRDPDGTITAYSWTWGDGGTSTGPTATHTYATAGTYEVHLTVRDNAGTTSGGGRTVTVTAPPPPPPPPDPTPAPPAPTSSPPPPPPANVAPTARFTFSASNLTVSTDAGASTDSDGTITAYSWTWGDGETSTGRAATHTYAAPGTYTVRLTVTDNAGATATRAETVTVARPIARPPVANFNATATGRNVTTDGGASLDPDGRALAYSWAWGDDTPNGTGRTATHTYAAPGSYTIRLTVTNDHGDHATTTREVTIPPPNRPPVAVLAVRADDLRIHATAEGSHDPDGDLAQLAWDWGDGSPLDTEAEASHTYAAPGNYTITLSVTDTSNATVATSRTVTLQASPPPPPATPTPTPPNALTPPSPTPPTPTTPAPPAPTAPTPTAAPLGNESTTNQTIPPTMTPTATAKTVPLPAVVVLCALVLALRRRR